MDIREYRVNRYGTFFVQCSDWAPISLPNRKWPLAVVQSTCQIVKRKADPRELQNQYAGIIVI